ncbi:cationic amino acid transporter 4-like [Equus quagga]|uniref:cationic amino acid transporter 4-like n=1 Tax=Equus quagga TaxID=89248 RepID=UPI001EE200C8|nr:cationic amino acid transporter 4-like [Equus quagga]
MARGLPSTTSLARFCQKLNRRKTLGESCMLSQQRQTTWDLILLGVDMMMGAGIYLLTGIVAKEMAGPAVLVSFGVAAMAALLAALCYAELGADVPCTDSPYEFTYLSMGELWAFLNGWNVTLGCLFGGANMARTWSSYLDAIFSHRLRSFTEAHVGTWQVPFLAQYPDFLAAAIPILVSTLVFCGHRVSSWLKRTLLAINLAVILFIIILGFVLACPHNWSTEEGGFVPFGFSGIMAAAATCFYSFLGFDVITFSSEKNCTRKRAVPMANAISLGLAAGAYILVSTVLTLMVPWHSLDPYWALADAFYQRGYSWAGFIVAAGSICGAQRKDQGKLQEEGPSELTLQILKFNKRSWGGMFPVEEAAHGTLEQERELGPTEREHDSGSREEGGWLCNVPQALLWDAPVELLHPASKRRN